MKILVLGATGALGREVVAQALKRGHDVTVFVRDPRRLTTPTDRLRVLVGDVLDDGDALTAAVHGQDVVISALGIGKALKPAGLIAGSVPRILRAMERESVRRLVFTSAFGVGETYHDAPFIPRIIFRTLLRRMYADKAAGEVELRRSPLDWTIVYPTRMTDGPATGQYRDGERLTLRGSLTISRADAADFLLAEAEDSAYVRTVVLISY